jgi:hypothetical protein
VLTNAQIAVIDEFGKLYGEKQNWTPRERRLEVLTETIRSWCPDLAADQTTVFAGTDCEIQVGEKPIEKYWISMPAVCKAAGGWKVFQKVCTVTFKAMAEVLGQSAAEALQTEARTVKRRLKAVAMTEIKLAA